MSLSLLIFEHLEIVDIFLFLFSFTKDFFF